MLFSPSGAVAVDFSKVVVFKHPDERSIEANRIQQIEGGHDMSRSKMRREIAKGRIVEDSGNPTGIEVL